MAVFAWDSQARASMGKATLTLSSACRPDLDRKEDGSARYMPQRAAQRVGLVQPLLEDEHVELELNCHLPDLLRRYSTRTRIRDCCLCVTVGDLMTGDLMTI